MRCLLPRCGVLLVIGVAAPLPVGFGQTPSVPILSVDVAVNRHPISPDIYGIANYGLDPAFAKEVQVPNVRWGGDTTTRYNWLVDSSNMGFDWYFLGGCSDTVLPGFPVCGETTPVPSYSVDRMIATYAAAGARSLITIPIIPFVNSTAASTCSFPVSVYGPQEKTDPSDHPDGETCGNSLSVVGGDQILDTDVYANHINNSVLLQQGWIQHLISAFGTAANGGVPYYQLDNEPSGWWNTHRDIMPNGADYPTITALGQTYAAMIKDTDPSANVFGPTDYSGNGWIGNPAQQSDLFAGQYYLQQMAAYGQQHGRRILDYFDEHYYATSTDDASELASTRTLWDPTYVSPDSVFNGPMQLLPRFRSWIQQYYPGTKLSISEYGFSSGRNPLVDGITQADVLGIFGREGLDFANIWTVPMPPWPVLCVFQLFRNYDGRGSQYGDTWVESQSTDQAALSVYGAQRSSDHTLTVLVINKTTQPITTTLSLASFSAVTAAVFSYSDANLTQILPRGEVPVASNQIDYTYPAYSATLFVIPDTGPDPTVVTSLFASTSDIEAGQTVTFTANVSLPSGSAAPTGAISFVNNQTILATIPLTGGQASFSTPELSSGMHTITAVYSGDLNYFASSSAPVSVAVSASPGFTLALSNSVLQIAPGGASNLTVTLTPHNGFAARVAFGCAGLPAGASCEFSPPDLSPQGNSVSAATMTITLPPSSGMLENFPSNGLQRPYLFLWLLAFTLIVLFARSAMRFSPKVRSACLWVIAASSVGLVGCALGSAGHHPQVESTPTAYVVTVTAQGPNAPAQSQEFILALPQ